MPPKQAKTVEIEDADVKSIAKLLNQSRAASGAKVQPLLVVTADGHVRMQGTDNFVEPLGQGTPLFSELENFMKGNYREDEHVFPVGIVSYPPLPFSPFSEEWQG